MTKALVDTSAWFAMAMSADRAHPSVRAAFERWDGRLVTTNFIFDEMITLVRARAGHATAVHIGDSVPDIAEIIRVRPEDEAQAWSDFVRLSDKEYSYTDCTSFAVMRHLGIAVALSTDRHFRQAGFQVEP